jgi:branched-subunit amino acid transport protein
MDQTLVFMTLLGMGAVTYLPRLLPLLILTRHRTVSEDGASGGASPLVEAWLGYVPAAVMAAMLFPSLFVVEGRANLSADNLYLWGAIPTLWIAWKTRSLIGSVLVGVTVVALGRLLLG